LEEKVGELEKKAKEFMANPSKMTDHNKRMELLGIILELQKKNPKDKAKYNDWIKFVRALGKLR
jgi:hypothetical protein